MAASNQCHLLDQREDQQRETFTNHAYHNIGVPVNSRLRAENGSRRGHIDPGLAGNPRVRSDAENGKYRVPTLRNVAVSGPYMHNGVFADLKTAIVFYNRFLVDNDGSRINPETGSDWRSRLTSRAEYGLKSAGRVSALNSVSM